MELPTELEREFTERRLKAGKSYPLTVVSPSEFVDSKPSSSDARWADSELVQLCDLLLGGACDALELPGRSPKTGRLRLARPVASVLAEALQVPWFQHIEVHRRFSVSVYPDNFNLAYPALLMKKRPSEESQQAELDLRFIANQKLAGALV
jgi:hypothetical protein